MLEGTLMNTLTEWTTDYMLGVHDLLNLPQKNSRESGKDSSHWEK